VHGKKTCSRFVLREGELSRFDNSQNVKMRADLLVERVMRLARATRQERLEFAVAFRGARRYRDIVHSFQDVWLKILLAALPANAGGDVAHDIRCL